MHCTNGSNEVSFSGMTQPAKHYRVNRVTVSPASPDWSRAEVANVDTFHSQSSGHHPRVQARLLNDGQNLLLRFDVDDRYMICQHANYQDSVCHDSCVEFFVQPSPTSGYFNFEINCCGTMLLMYIEDNSRATGGPNPFQKMVWVPEEWGRQVKITTSVPNLIPQSLDEPRSWWMEARIPLSMLEHFAGKVSTTPGQKWRANFYKCADKSSHPHWASWAPVGDPLNFHKPEKFAELEFA